MSTLQQTLDSAVLRHPRRRTRSRLLRAGVLVFASTLAWHASNFAFNAVTARLLGPSGYSELAAAVTILYVSSPVLTSIQTLMSRDATSLMVAARTDAIRGVVAARIRWIAIAGLLVAAAGAASSHLLAQFLHLRSGWPIVIVCGGLCLSGVTHCQRGALQGTQRFGRYAVSTLVEAVVKVTAAAVLVGLFSRSVGAAVASVPVAAACALVVNGALLRVLPRGAVKTGRRLPGAEHRRSLATVATFVPLSLLLSADVLAAKRYLPSHLAGLYAAVSLSGKVVFFATSALSMFLFPLFSERRDRNVDGRPQLAFALVAICVCSGGLALTYTAAPSLVIGPLFGGGYAAAAPYLGLIAVAFAGYAVAYLVATFLLAQGVGLGAVVLALGALLQLGALYVRHGSIAQIVDVQVGVLWTLALTLVAIAFRSPKARRVAAA